MKTKFFILKRTLGVLLALLLAVGVFPVTANAYSEWDVDTVAGLNYALGEIEDGGMIRLAAGTYEIDSTILISKSLIIIGLGDVTIVPSDSFTAAQNADKYFYLMSVVKDAPGIIDGFTLENIKFDTLGKSVAYPGGSSPDIFGGVYFSRVANASVSGCSASNCSLGLNIEGSQVTVDGFSFTNDKWPYNISVEDYNLPGELIVKDGGLGADAVIYGGGNVVFEDTDGWFAGNIGGSTLWTANESLLSAFGATSVYSVILRGANGDSFHPSIADAVAKAASGDTVIIREGSYAIDEMIIIDKPLTLEGEGDVVITAKEPWYDHSNGNPWRNLISIENTSKVHLENLTFEGSLRSGINIFESTKVTIKNVTSKNNAAAGIIVNGSEVTIEGVATENNQWGGINVDRAGAKLTAISYTSADETTAVWSEMNDPDVTMPANWVEATENGRTTWTYSPPPVTPPSPPTEEIEDDDPPLSGDMFDDIEGHWAKDYINILAMEGYVNGVADRIFAPQSDITRAQFVQILANVFAEGELTETETGFDDVAPGAWYAKSVAWAVSKGIVNGVSETEFEPESNITREQMAAIISRAAQVFGFELTAVKEEADFADDAAISAYAKGAVYEMQAAGIIDGKPGNLFDPVGKATRAEAAKVIYGLLVTGEIL